MNTKSEQTQIDKAGTPSRFGWVDRLLRRKPTPQVTDITTRALGAKDLPLIQYLDNEKTFDLLAIIENGFSYLDTRETHSTATLAKQISGDTRLNFGAGLPFFDVSLGGTGDARSQDMQQQITKTSLVHTTGSLFARLRTELYERQLVIEINNSTSLFDICNGDFVEFEAKFQRSRFDEALNVFGGFAPFFGSLINGPTSLGQQPNAPDISPTEIPSILGAMQGTGAQYLVANVGYRRFVVMVRKEHFVEPTMSEVLDGTFRVFGKVVRVIPDDNANESIDILRSSPLSRFTAGNEALATMEDGLVGLQSESITKDTVIAGPTLQVIPIAIFA